MYFIILDGLKRKPKQMHINAMPTKSIVQFSYSFLVSFTYKIYNLIRIKMVDHHQFVLVAGSNSAVNAILVPFIRRMCVYVCIVCMIITILSLRSD